MTSRCVNAILASMRMNCCQLNNHLFINTISPNKFCNCGEEETIFHFFFECRYVLINETLSIVKILQGDKSLCTSDITKPHEAVSKFIVSSKRFTIFLSFMSHFNHQMLIIIILLSIGLDDHVSILSCRY